MKAKFKFKDLVKPINDYHKGFVIHSEEIDGIINYLIYFETIRKDGVYKENELELVSKKNEIYK